MNLSLTLPLPPSTNTRLIKAKGGFFILSAEARSWLTGSALVVRAYCSRKKLKPIAKYFHIDLNVYLSRSNSDSHNYLKLLCDALEQGGLTTNDKFIMPRIQRVEVDSNNPRIEINFNG